MKYKKKIHKLFLIGILLTLKFPAFGLTDDTDQPVIITSDKQSLDIINHTNTYIDNVMIQQGSIKITASKVVVIRPNGDPQKTVVDGFGDPITFYQMQDNGKSLKGHSDKLRYTFSDKLLVLTSNAYLDQLDSHMEADRITYLIPQKKMHAFSAKGKPVYSVLLHSQLKN
ncbi:lipopolysaccharide transport periplasmic protein LptA [Candidatus Williamhamiltonella defendens]|uniref:lipopolysaccharide transport periplasmic protein LptA n=1 Tax=Candidatus Williamhamiltonella defendens TaxID=138072 RepID=UPI00130E08FE|nr:lipopolysaccharide transport periplasmic protein LptA [Candidatus Hamiltonella defensa]